MRIEPGEIRVNAVGTILDETNVKVWHVDLHSKYAAILSLSDEEVLLCAAGDTLGVDETHRGTPTAVALPALGDGWSVMAECRRYTLRVVAYRSGRVLSTQEVAL